MRTLLSITILSLTLALVACAPYEPTESKRVHLRFTSGAQGEGFPDEGGVVTFDQRWQEEVLVPGKVVSVVNLENGPIRLLHRPLTGENGKETVETVLPSLVNASVAFRDEPLRGLWAIAYDPNLVTPGPDGRMPKMSIEINYRP